MIESRLEGGERLYAEGEADVAAVCAKLARFGIDARHLRPFRTAADREVGLLSAVVAPALRSRNPERRQGPRGPAVAGGAGPGALRAPLLAIPPGSRVLLMAIDLKSRVREVPDWPEPGVGFKDVSPLLRDPEALTQTIESLADWTREQRPDLVLGAEARGFILGAAIAKGGSVRLRPGAAAREASAGDGQRDLRARVRSERARAERRCDRIGCARRHPRRRARDGGDGRGDRRPRRAARRGGRGGVLHHRAGLSRRSRAPVALPASFADRVLSTLSPRPRLGFTVRVAD